MIDERFRYEDFGDEKYLIDSEMGETWEIGDERILENINGMHDLIVSLISRCAEKNVDINDIISTTEYDYLGNAIVDYNDGLGYNLG